MKGGLKPVFTNSAIFAKIDAFKRNKIEQIAQMYAYAGENFVNAAVKSGTYTDRTGNLRSSIGYAVIMDGRILKKQISGKKNAKAAANELLSELITEYNVGIGLIGFAGMEYALAVESRGYDVITSSTPAADELLQTLKKELGLK